MTLVEILAGANVALRLIQERLLTFVALLLTFALFGWAMWLQSILGAIIAGTWGLSIFLPVLFSGRGTSHVRQPPENQSPEGTAHGS